MTTTLFAPTALLPDGWTRDVRLTLDGARIAAVEPGAAPGPGDRVLTGQALIPAMPNLHSHAFQRAMAGMTERRGPGDDSFWTWRTLMYRFLDLLTPDDVEAIAALVQVEMLESGYGSVAEFHYLHHQPGGTPYADPAELAHRIAAAAADTGIGLTLLPVLYSFGGAGEAPLAGGQRRFGNDLDGFLRLREAAGRHLAADAVLGTAPHSLRATTPAQIARARRGPARRPAAHPRRRAGAGGRGGRGLARRPPGRLPPRPRRHRPALVPDPRHPDDRRRDGAARRLRRGRRPLPDHRVEPRRRHLPRHRPISPPAAPSASAPTRTCASPSPRSSAPSSTASACATAPATASPPPAPRSAPPSTPPPSPAAPAPSPATAARSRPGALADLVAIDRSGDTLGPLADDQLLDGWIFAADDRVVREVWSAGRHVVRDGRHVARDRVAARYRRTMADLMARM